MNKIEINIIGEIKNLHEAIQSHFRLSLDKAIRIGQLLSEQKKSLDHGNFTGWINNNLPFTDRTERNYMNLYHERDRLKTETISDLKQAYNLLIEHKVSNDSTDYISTTERLEKAVSLLNEVSKQQLNDCTFEELVEIHRIAVEIEKLGREIKLIAAWHLGEVLNRASPQEKIQIERINLG